MKRSKSFLFAVLFLVIVLIFAGCSAPKGSKELTAYELVKSAVDKNIALESSEIEMGLKMSMSIMGISLDVPINYNIKTAKENGYTKASAVMNMDLMGESLNTNIYVDNDYIYLSDSSGEKMKLPVSNTLASEYNVSKIVEQMMKELPEDILKDVQIVNNNNGSKTVNVEISEEKFNEIFREYTNSAFSSVLSELSGEDNMDIKFYWVETLKYVNDDD